MIKTIKKIDLQGNEEWQEVCICNRCKKTLEPTNFVYETKWTAWHTVKMEPGIAWGFGEGSNPVKHICTDCQKEVEAFLNGEYRDTKDTTQETPRLLTFTERVEATIPYYRNEKTEALKEYAYSYMCTREAYKAIEIILKERGVSL